MRITSYTYDNYNRLSNATANAFSRNYQYDEWGNVKNFSGLTLNYATNGSGAPSTNRLLSDSQGGSYTYDAAGNQTAGAGQSYSYDGANRLKEVGTGGANVYGYDGDGKRVKKTEGGSTTYYIYSSKLGQSVMEVSANSVQRAFVYNGGKLVAMQATDGQFYWLHTNHLSNSRAMTDGSGNLTYKGQFDPYGASLTEWSASGNTNLNNKKFAGYERDNSGLDYAQARMYNPARGRFQTPDPAGVKAANHKIPQSLNRYSYVQNDPVNATDSTGNFLSYCEWKFWEFFSGNMVSWMGFLEATNDRCGGFNWKNVANKLAGEVGGGSGEEPKRIKPQVSYVGLSQRVEQCGDVQVDVGWKLFGGSNPSGINGWVIQHIQSSFTVKNPDGTIKKDANGAPMMVSKDFYEAWQVINGEVKGGDTYLFKIDPHGYSTRGSYRVVGTVNFFWDDEIRPNPSTWNGTEPDANGLPNRGRSPSGWNTDGALHRELNYSWNCTDPKGNYEKPTFSHR